jgi:hypothetical protein
MGTGTGDKKVAVTTVGKDGPDPFLLATKAAVNLFNQNSQKLLPGCGTINDGSEDCSTDWPVRLSSAKPPPVIVLSNAVEEDSSQFSDLDEDE